MDDSDEALMAKVARGDERAFQLLSRRHLPAMLGVARRILGNAAEAEDVAQEAFMRVWTHAPRWQPLAQFRTWLTRVVVNLCLDRKRRAKSSTPHPAPASGRRSMSASACSRRRLKSFPRASAARSCSLTAKA
jgi:RNA polymerase sigma-70 factor (ECF subfamily)